MRLVLCAAFLAVATVFCQTFGEITGEVTDSSGGVIPGAKISATNLDTNAARDAFTNGAGVYSFPSLPPSVYNLRVEKSGFKVVAHNNLRIDVQQNVRLDFELPVGQVTESLEVSASAAHEIDSVQS